MAQRAAKRTFSPEAFGRFLRRLSSEDEQAVREYQLIRGKLVRFFIHRGCTNSEELFDETVDIVSAKIDNGVEIANPLAYCYAVARNVLRQSERNRKPVSLDDDLVSPQPIDMESREEQLQCLDHCVSRLSEDERQIVARYHEGQGREKIETRKSLAARVGGVNVLRIKVCRIHKKLRSCVLDCLNRSAKAKSLEVEAG
jgi:DNA-directed RNA polymerase specialized sigma24 family protein